MPPQLTGRRSEAFWEASAKLAARASEPVIAQQRIDALELCRHHQRLIWQQCCPQRRLLADRSQH